MGRSWRASAHILMLVSAVIALAALSLQPARATEPSSSQLPFTFFERSPESASIPTLPAGSTSASDTGSGSSAWVYRDPSDAFFKSEGSYAAFDDQQSDTYGLPHGGYSTTSNRCKICHAVHRATGVFALTRADSPDDSCAYCHLGSHRHAESQAYFGGEDGIYSENGHTIGAGPEIPLSTVWQWTEETTVAPSGETTTTIDIPAERLGWVRSAEASDTTQSAITVRRWEPTPNRLMHYAIHGERWIRVGPDRMRCTTCHQVHNASRQIWKPLSSKTGQRMTGGYKLLRDVTAGLLSVNPADVTATGELATDTAGPRAQSRRYFLEYDPGASGSLDGLPDPQTDYRIRSLEGTLNVLTGLDSTGNVVSGPNVTGYTPFRYAIADTQTAVATESPIFETSLSWWCANCHNLSISGPRQRNDGGFGPDAGVHGWPHPVPGMLGAGTSGDAGSQCYDCHNNDMPLDASLGDGCGGCHISPKMYRYYKSGESMGGKTWAQRSAETSTGFDARSDFPHSGPSSSRALLSARDRIGAGSAADPDDEQGRAYEASSSVSTTCIACHAPGALNAEVYGN